MHLSKRPYVYLIIILLLGLFLRLVSIYPNNIILGFDQTRDLFAARRIFVEGDLRIVGPTAGNNAALHHGVAFLYFIIPPIFLGGGNPFWVSLWISLFNLASAGVLYLFAKSLFKSERAGLIAAFLASVSYYFVQFAGWISNPSPTLLTVPLFFYGLWRYKQGQALYLPLSLFFLGLSIQFELFFLYLIPVFIVLWLLLKPKFPDRKVLTAKRVILSSLLALSLSLSTMLLTEFKFRFSGVLTLLSDLTRKTGAKQSFFLTLKEFFNRFFETFSLNLSPSGPEAAGVLIGCLLLGYLVYQLFRSRKGSGSRLALLFLVTYLLSPVTMLVLGFHAAPWTLIGLSPAIILLAAYFLSKIKSGILITAILLVVGALNIKAVTAARGVGQPLLGPDTSSIVSGQLAAIDYTYQKAGGAPFAINTVTNPLYVNAVWAWNYKWYGEKKYGYLPSWLGGDQEKPYNILSEDIRLSSVEARSESKDNVPIFFLIVDQSPRIPEVHKILALNWAGEHGKLVEEKDFEGIKILLFKPF